MADADARMRTPIELAGEAREAADRLIHCHGVIGGMSMEAIRALLRGLADALDAATASAPAAIVQATTDDPRGGGWHAFADLDEAFRFVRDTDRDGTLIRIVEWTYHLGREGEGDA